MGNYITYLSPNNDCSEQIFIWIPKQSAEATAVHTARNNVMLVFFRVIDVTLALLPQAAIVPYAVITVPYVSTIEETYSEGVPKSLSVNEE